MTKPRRRSKPVTNARRRTTRRASNGQFVGSTTQRTHNRTRARAQNVSLHRRPNRSVVVYQGAPAIRRNRTRRTHNPGMKDLLTTSMAVGAGVVLTDIMVNIVGNFIPANLLGGPWGAIALRFGAAYVLGMAGERFFSKNTANLMAAGGAAGAVQDLARVALGQIGGILAPPQPVVLPQQAQPLQLPPGQTGQMADLVRWRRRGLNDLVYGPGTQAWYQG